MPGRSTSIPKAPEDGAPSHTKQLNGFHPVILDRSSHRCAPTPPPRSCPRSRRDSENMHGTTELDAPYANPTHTEQPVNNQDLPRCLHRLFSGSANADWATGRVLKTAVACARTSWVTERITPDCGRDSKSNPGNIWSETARRSDPAARTHQPEKLEYPPSCLLTPRTNG